MTTGEEVRSGPMFMPTAGSSLPGSGGLIAVVIPQSCEYQYFDGHGCFLVTSMELWDDGVVVHISCPTPQEAADLSDMLLQDNAGTGYRCSSRDIVGRSAIPTYKPAAPDGIRTLSVHPQHPASSSSGFVAAVRLKAPSPRGGRLRRLP